MELSKSSKVKYLAEYINGYAFKPDDWGNEGLPIIRIQNLTDQLSPSNYTTVTPPEKYKVLPGDILISWSASLGVHVWNQGPGLLNQHIFKAVPRDDIHRGYFTWAARWFIGELAERAHGSTMQHLTREAFGNFDVPLPSFGQQICIANFLDEQSQRIDVLITEKESLLQGLSEYQYSYASMLMTRGMNPSSELVDTSFPEIGAIPQHWDMKRLKFLGEVRSGVAKGKDLGEKTTVSLPYLRVANVQDGYVDLSEVLDIEVGENEAGRYFLRKGDVLMNEGGDNDKLGRGTVWEAQIDPCIHQNHVFAVRLFDVSLAEWVARFTSTDAARSYFFLRSKQSTNLASINQSNVRELPVPMPPDVERKAILDEIRRSATATSELIEHTKEHIARLREYRSSLISTAVTGQIDISTFKVAA